MTVIDMDVKRRRKKKKASIQKYAAQGEGPSAGPSQKPGLSLVKPSHELPAGAGAETDTAGPERTAEAAGSAAGPELKKKHAEKEGISKRQKGADNFSEARSVTEKRKKKKKKDRKRAVKRNKKSTAVEHEDKDKTENGKGSVKSGAGKRRRKRKKKKYASGRPDRAAKRTSRRGRKRKQESEYISGPFSLFQKDRRQSVPGEEPRLRWGRRRRGGLIALAVLGFLLITAAGAFFFILKHYHINKVYVEGNTHYTNEEIKQFVTGRRFGDNSLYLSYMYKQEDTQNIPFIEKMDVKVLSADSIKITVYEKAVAGYVSYLDHYMYFDKDGIIVESVDEPTGRAPQVIGLDFDHVLLHEKLPVADDTIFAQILEVTQLMEKYEVHADKIYFNDNSNMTLYFGMARVALGKMTGIDEKIMKLKALLPELEGRRGVLQMENYTEETKLITFQKD